MREKVIISWSGGKDSAIALHEIQRCENYEILALLTTVTEDYDRVSMHGIRRILVEQQAGSLGLPLEKVFISSSSSNEGYESQMRETLLKYKALGVCCVVFGDIFLEDIRGYREENMAKIGMNGIFPLWGRDTSELTHTFIDLGFKAVITCIDSDALNRLFVGRMIDKQLISELPSSVDPCGENGEYHTFVYDGPIFKDRILHNKGEIVLRDKRFYYCDIIPSQG